MLVVSMPMGAISDRVGRRTPMLAGLVALAASTLLFAYSLTLPGLFAARLVQGAADVAQQSLEPGAVRRLDRRPRRFAQGSSRPEQARGASRVRSRRGSHGDIHTANQAVRNAAAVLEPPENLRRLPVVALRGLHIPLRHGSLRQVGEHAVALALGAHVNGRREEHAGGLAGGERGVALWRAADGH